MKHGPRTILLKLLTILLSGSPYQWWTRQQGTAGSGQVQLQQSLDNGHVQRLLRATSAKIAALAGTSQFKIFVMVNIKEFGGNELVKYITVKEIVTCWRSSPLNKSDQVISWKQRDGVSCACTWSGPQATSSKLQAPSLLSIKPQASSPKQQASSSKPQASSSMILEPRYI